LDKAFEIEPMDSTNKNDMKTLESAINLERVVQRSLEKSDFTTCVEYLTQILDLCPASVNHSVLKIECLLKNSQLTDALAFTEKLVSSSHFNNNPVILGWRGRVLIYTGSETLGKKILQEALKNDPDNAVL
jgi:predicted Zn-dependent protease